MSATDCNKKETYEEKKTQPLKGILHLNLNSKTYNPENIVKLTAEVRPKPVKSQLKSTMRELIRANIKQSQETRAPVRESEKFKRINEQWGSYGGNKSRKDGRGRNRDALNRSFLSSTKRSSIEFEESRSSSVDRGEKIFVNLEEVALEEDKLSVILEGLWQSWNLQKAAEEWWEITTCSSLFKLENLFMNERLRRAISQAKMLETISIGLLTVKAKEIRQNAPLSASIRNLIYYVHQNFLILIEFVLSRTPSSVENLWVSALKSIIKYKQAKAHDANLLSLLEHNNEIIKNLLRNLCSIGKTKNIHDIVLLSCIKMVDTVTVAVLRDKVYKLVFPLIYQGDITTSMFDTKTERKVEEEKTLCTAPPFLPKLDESKEATTYTLILDLDETLVHYFEWGNEGKFLVRPGTEEFLKEMSKYYEIVIFTAATQDYADWVINNIDPNHYISHRLYRQHAYSKDSNVRIVKDLKYLGRDLSKIIIIDNIAENFQNQPENGIFIKSFFDDMEDRSLLELMPLLKEIVETKVPDVRAALRLYRDRVIRKITACEQHV